MSTTTMTPVSSSNVGSIGYDPETQTLSVYFHTSGRTYHYPGVSQEMADSLYAAPSKGKWVSARLVKTNWPFTKG